MVCKAFNGRGLDCRERLAACQPHLLILAPGSISENESIQKIDGLEDFLSVLLS